MICMYFICIRRVEFKQGCKQQHFLLLSHLKAKTGFASFYCCQGSAPRQQLQNQQENLSCVKAHTGKEFSISHFTQTADLWQISYSKSSFQYKKHNRNMPCIYDIALPHIAGMRQILLCLYCLYIFLESILVSVFARYNSLSR